MRFGLYPSIYCLCRNLFEGGEPKGIDFQFECDAKLQTSSGYKLFRPSGRSLGQELVILQQQFGKTSYDACRLKVLVKDSRLHLAQWRPEHRTG